MAKRINWDLVARNISEAREALEELEALARNRRSRNRCEEWLQVGLEHAYHHLNFAWNARHATAAQYRHLTDTNFNRWSGFPKVMHIAHVGVTKKGKRDA